MAEPLRLLVVDDAPEHARMVEEFVRFSETWADADVRTAVSYDEALGAFAERSFDIAVFDYWLGSRDGLSLLREIRQRGIDTPVVVLTSRGAEEVAVEAMKAGALEFLEKPFEEEVLLHAIQIALRGGPPGQDPTEKKRLQAIFEALSPREQQVLDGVVAGKLNKVIAFELGISPRTVEVYRAKMMAKTGAAGLSDLIRIALLAGF